jgi:uncharacterized protein (TIGR03435 family)
VMLGNLLRDRFHLRFHMESKILPVYALRVAKNGPKFKETARRPDDAPAGSRPPMERDAQGFVVLPPEYQGHGRLPSPRRDIYDGSRRPHDRPCAIHRDCGRAACRR